ncbi:MAG: 23S rRNA (pseudouridine(1915)-N(3))-methyltransferase RlmH [Bacteroidota bacterium]
MKIVLISIRKDDDKAYKAAMDDYISRIKRFIPFELQIIDIGKKIPSMPIPKQKMEEGKLLQKSLKQGDHIILLDEKGKSFTSKEFAKHIEKKMLLSYHRLVFVIGGPFGFSDEVYALTNEKLALSKMTFSHQMIRLFFVEQLYRAYSILNNGKYHHE